MRIFSHFEAPLRNCKEKKHWMDFFQHFARTKPDMPKKLRRSFYLLNKSLRLRGNRFPMHLASSYSRFCRPDFALFLHNFTVLLRIVEISTCCRNRDASYSDSGASSSVKACSESKIMVIGAKLTDFDTKKNSRFLAKSPP